MFRPYEMGNAIRGIKSLAPIDPQGTLNSIFQDMAEAVRSCGILGTMTPLQIPEKIYQIQVQHTLVIEAETPFVGKTLYCRAYYDGQLSSGDWAIISGLQYATINENGKVDVASGTSDKNIIVQCRCNGMTVQKTINISYDNEFAIQSAPTIVGTSGNVVFTWNGEWIAPPEVTFSIISGNQYATIDENAFFQISGTGDVVVQASYNGETATRTVRVEYVADTSSQTVIEEDGTIYTDTQTVVENQDGSTTTTTSAVTYNPDGSFVQTETTTIDNQDGSSSTTQETTNSDGTSSETTSTTFAPDQDGTVTTSSNTTYYDSNGDETGTSVTNKQEYEDGSSTT